MNKDKTLAELNEQLEDLIGIDNSEIEESQKRKKKIFKDISTALDKVEEEAIEEVIGEIEKLKIDKDESWTRPGKPESVYQESYNEAVDIFNKKIDNLISNLTKERKDK